MACGLKKVNTEFFGSLDTGQIATRKCGSGSKQTASGRIAAELRLTTQQLGELCEWIVLNYPKKIRRIDAAAAQMDVPPVHGEQNDQKPSTSKDA